MTVNFALKFAAVVLAPFVAVALIAGNGGGSDADLAADPDDGAEASAAPEWGGQEIILDRRDDGHFYTEAMVEGTPVQFLIDTGASTIALTGSDAEAIGIDWNVDEVAPVARGAGGTVHGVRVTLNEVRIGDFEARNIDAAIIPEGLPVSLLGQSFLKQVPDLAIQDDRMVLRN